MKARCPQGSTAPKDCKDKVNELLDSLREAQEFFVKQMREIQDAIGPVHDSLADSELSEESGERFKGNGAGRGFRGKNRERSGQRVHKTQAQSTSSLSSSHSEISEDPVPTYPGFQGAGLFRPIPPTMP